jgi:KTSC domain
MKAGTIFWFLAVVFSCASPAALFAADSPAPIISHIQRESSAITAVGYSKRLHALEIEFRNGAIYRYLNVPPSVHGALIAAPSKARFYDENIRGKYRSVHVRSRQK